MSNPSLAPLDPPPRKAGLRRGIKNVRRAYRSVFALVILVFGGWATLDAFRWYDLVYRIKTSEAMVLKKQELARPGAHEYRLEYAFTVDDGTRIDHEASVGASVFDKTVKGKAIPVLYISGNPKAFHWLFDNDADRSHFMFLTLGHGLVALLAIVILRVMERPLAKELRLARRGLVAPGQIVTVGKPRGRRGIVRITYTFKTATDAVLQGACNLPRRFPVHTLEPGTAIEVLYDAKRPRAHKPRLALDHVEFGEAGKKKI
jgi:hypothetical protein